MNKKSIYEVFWSNFERLEKDSGMSRSVIEKNSGIRTGYLKHIKEKRHLVPGSNMVEKMARTLEVYYDEFYWEEEE